MSERAIQQKLGITQSQAADYGLTIASPPRREIPAPARIEAPISRPILSDREFDLLHELRRILVLPRDLTGVRGREVKIRRRTLLAALCAAGISREKIAEATNLSLITVNRGARDWRDDKARLRDLVAQARAQLKKKGAR